MEQGLNSGSNAPPRLIDKSKVYDVKPLRILAPVFPNPPGMCSASTPNPTPFGCIPPSGPFPAGVQPFYPFLVSNGSQPTTTRNQSGNTGFDSSIPGPVPLNAFRTPAPHVNGIKNQSDQYASMPVPDADGASNSGKRTKGRPKRRPAGNGEEINVESVANDILTLFKLKEFDDSRRANGDKDTAATVLLVFDLIRRRLTQLEEARSNSSGRAWRPDLKASNLMMTKGLRTNKSKRVGHIPVIDVGDIFFFRMELCLVGLHTQTMAGIDYMSVKVTVDKEPVAVSIVSAGGYDDNDGDDTNVLIYSGQGGVHRKDGQKFDQKLEGGNLALEKSMQRGNDVRVVRGIKDTTSNAPSKIYVYDGLYKIHESWIEKYKSGCNVFKYKLIRQPGQPEAYSLWKSIQQWRDGTATRPALIIPDLSLGSETQPVALVNDIDGEKAPAHFSYVASLKYSQPFPSSKVFSGCHCVDGCEPGDTSCPCIQKNEGLLPYSSTGVLLTTKSLIHECGQTCQSPLNGRNRISQAGVKFRLEVFKTKNQGWGLRSWDPIRSGSFICEYAGDIVKVTAGEFENANDDSYIFDTGRYYVPLERVHDSNCSKKAPFPLVISAKNNGNVSRFMNHSCSPNVFWQPILRESNNGVCLHIAFFAIRHIPPMQELTYDYGIPAKADRGMKRCLCGSVKCRGQFY
ncbi:histone-lysine N-methyltransferase, H3 lysine-9 specific SUVH1-like [Salvia splendens]|uniref:histone-lysine N-methyltransferase, H3 lysine-9 specific SUVH1-like n=1 Tax=Salvia splendens TaxID=180675 RepID=UPI001C25ECE4|nr:histone-lysine N-methyltransferase, H3 lysine-9 specific SUVH1-like [Salvia splendens]XP_042062908.1 histone-lysine N-methyltransferase, H3 lysine-9 specific SUVH1-like [Salvia splendens]